MEELRDRVAVITGGASGIGLASAMALAREGVHCMLADIEADALDRAVAQVAGLGVKAEGHIVDVRDRDAVAGLADPGGIGTDRGNPGPVRNHRCHSGRRHCNHCRLQQRRQRFRVRIVELRRTGVRNVHVRQ